MTEEIQQMLAEHVDKQYYLIPVGKKVAYTELFGELLLQSTTSLDQHYVLKGTLDHLVAAFLDDIHTVFYDHVFNIVLTFPDGPVDQHAV